MDEVVARTLRPWEGTQLRRMKHQRSNAVNHCHGRIILLARGKVRNREIARRVDRSPQWVRRIIHRFNEGGIDAIMWYPAYCNRRGARRFLADVAEQIAEVALSPPKQLIGMSVWSLPNRGARVIRTPAEAPNANAFAESWVATVKRECLNYFMCFSLGHLNHIAQEYTRFYNGDRPHQGVGNRPLSLHPRVTADTESTGPICCRESLGGLLKAYYRKAA